MLLFVIIIGFIIAVNIFLFTICLKSYKKEQKEFREDITEFAFEIEDMKKTKKQLKRGYEKLYEKVSEFEEKQTDSNAHSSLDMFDDTVESDDE